MTLTPHTRKLLNYIQELLPVDEDDIVQRGIVQATLDRIVKLRQRAAQLADCHGSLDALEAQVQTEEIAPDDHTLYTDLLEWRAVRHELAQLADFLELA